MLTYTIRNIVAAILGYAMRPLEFRFSKDYRHGTTRWHRFVYACVNTVAANYVAWGDDPRCAIFWGFDRQRRYVRNNEG